MSLIAFRVLLLAGAVATSGAWLAAAPLLWISIALMVVGLAAIVAALAGVEP